MPPQGSVGRRLWIALLAFVVVGCPLGASDPSEAKGGPCASGMAHVTSDDLKPYCIDRWEASVVEVKNKREVAHSPYEPVTNLEIKAVSKPDVVPQGYISKSEAEQACKTAKKRLCTGDEWQRACRGRKPTTFPYGDERKSGYCNDSGRAPLASLHPGEDVYSSATAMNDPRINQAPNTVAKTGSYAKCKNAYGVHDMVGNLHEWTSELTADRGTFRGGYYQDTHQNGDGCGYKTVAHAVTYHDYSTGFRCCADPR